MHGMQAWYRCTARNLHKQHLLFTSTSCIYPGYAQVTPLVPRLCGLDGQGTQGLLTQKTPPSRAQHASGPFSPPLKVDLSTR